MEEEFDLIENLHLLSNDAIDNPLKKLKSHTIIFFDDYYAIEDFTDRNSFTYQMALLEASDKKINLILKNFDKAISTKSNNLDIDLNYLNYTNEFSYRIHINKKEQISTKRYILLDPIPKDAELFKNYWLFYFLADCKKIVWNIRDILGKPQPEKKELINILDKNLKSNISYEYFSSFYDAISNQNLIFDNSFITTHRCDITHYKDYFKDEINQNLLKMDLSKREDYLELLIYKIQTTPFYNFDKTLTEVYLSKYDVDLNNFPKDLNEELYDILKTYPNCTYLNAIKKIEITQIQQSFYAYFSKIEAIKMVEFLKSKKKTVLEPKNPNQLSKNKSKSSSSKILINKI